jgi:photosynthetic reaction center H subunit
MSTGAITQYVDVAQLALYGFWIFFAGLVYYLHRENKREGYPLESERSAHVTVQGYPAIPSPKTYRLQHGGTFSAPNDKRSMQRLAAESVGRGLGSALEPTGDPMLAAVGPGSYADRADVADVTYEGAIKIVPLRVAPGFDTASKDTDPRGLKAVGADGKVGGTITDVWVDRSEMLFRYLEVAVPVAGGMRHVLIPINFARITRREVGVVSIMGHHFAQVPTTKHPDQVTLLEEEKIMAFYGGGTLYAHPSRKEPLL